MLTTPQIKDYAVRGHTSAINIAREYCQHLFLSSLYQQSAAHKLFFKGGTALRIVYKSPRFSEDLDFESPQKDIAAIEQAVVGALAAVESAGIPTELTEATTTSGGYLSAATFQLPDFLIESRLEISLRNNTSRGEIVTIVNDYVPTYTLIQLAPEQLIGGKIKALLTRRKPRDFYDLYFILRANLLPPEERDILKDVLTVLQETDLASGQRELKEFLPQSHWAIIKDLPTVLKREVQRFM